MLFYRNFFLGLGAGGIMSVDDSEYKSNSVSEPESDCPEIWLWQNDITYTYFGFGQSDSGSETKLDLESESLTWICYIKYISISKKTHSNTLTFLVY